LADSIVTGGIEQESAVDRLAGHLRHAIAEGTPPAYTPLPSYREIAKTHGVSLWTVRAALDVLEKEGLVERHERRGTFARPVLSAEPRAGAMALRCINFVEHSWSPGAAAVEFVRSDHLVGYTQALEHENRKMRFASLPPDSANFETVLSPMFSHHEQGCVLRSLICPDFLNWLLRTGIPFVVQHAQTYSRTDIPDHHKVFANKTKGAFEATNYLLGLGHRRIGFMGELSRADCSGFPPVFDGFRSALACAGLEPDPADVVEFSTDDIGAAKTPARAFLDRPDPPTAVLPQTDAMAMAFIEEARSLGMRIPGDLSVVGFNARPESALTDPPLTTVATPRRQLGRTAVEMLLQAARGEFKEFQTRILDCRLVHRESAGPPR